VKYSPKVEDSESIAHTINLFLCQQHSIVKIMGGKTNINRKILEKVARLAKIELSAEEKEMLITECTEILDAFSLLKEVDVEGLDPSFHPIQIQESLREDKVGECLSQSESISNVKSTKGGYVKGPGVR